MTQDAPFTFDLFGNFSGFGQDDVSAGLGFGVTALAGSIAIRPNNDDDPDPVPPAPGACRPVGAPTTELRTQGAPANFYLDEGDRGLASGWRERAGANVAIIELANEIVRDGRPATPEEQARLIRFTGFGASELANGMFRRPGEEGFRDGWDGLGSSLEDAVSAGDYAALARSTQYAHFTPEFVVRAIWKGLQRLGWRGGRVLEPGIGTGLFPALMPDSFRECSLVTGVELDPVTARIVRLLQPRARILEGDFARTNLPEHFDLAIGNPPFSDRIVRSDRAYRSLGLRLHDYFLARSIYLLKPGALAAFVTSHGTLDKADKTAREHIANKADLITAIRLPEGSFRQGAGTDVVVDILFFRKRRGGEIAGDRSWLDLVDVCFDSGTDGEGRGSSLRQWLVRPPPGDGARHSCARNRAIRGNLHLPAQSGRESRSRT